MALDPASLPDDVDALKRLIVGLAREAVHASTLIEKLRGELARMKQARFGTSSEKLGTRLEQLELALEARVRPDHPLRTIIQCLHNALPVRSPPKS